jgi:asparagine synthase (glutamine-hydrolysing)
MLATRLLPDGGDCPARLGVEAAAATLTSAGFAATIPPIMCGIAGIVDLHLASVDRPTLEAMCASQAHRGPDDQGLYLQPGVGLGQRRLAIIDLAGGKQPLANEDGSVWVTFNGEIYNFQQLKVQLESLGHRFATHSDTEVIVHAYEQYGTRCLQHFRGMFAFAVWDARRREIFLARDRLGKKPLLYALAGGQLVFASEFQGLLRHHAIDRTLDLTALDEYLTFGYVPAPKTIYRGVWKLPPAHFLHMAVSGQDAPTKLPAPERYWRLSYQPKQVIDEQAAVEGLLDALTEATRLRLIADVPLGVLLSGGLDSSMVAALMSRLPGGRVKTFSIGFEEQEFNELPYARAVAERYATDHHEMIVRTHAIEVLPRLVRHYGEPYADSSAVPTYYVSQMTRQHVTVALNGDGGDECLGGYERYLGQLLALRYQRLPWLLRRLVIEPAAALVPGSLSRRSRLQQAKRFLQRASLPTAQRYAGWVTFFTPEQKRELYRPDFEAALAGHDGLTWLLDAFADQRHRESDTLDQVLAVDVETYLPNDLLVKMDIASMANSLETRSPFLDHKVMEFTATLPSALKIKKRSLKYLLKRAAVDFLPPQNLTRRKMGFGVPVGAWMRGELRSFLQDTLLAPTAFNSRLLRRPALEAMIDAHLAGRKDHAYQLWSLLWLELWAREFAV